jgi:uncharacterized protein (TIGR02594 family)
MHRVFGVLLVVATAALPIASRANDRLDNTHTHTNDRPELCPSQDWCGCWLATYLHIHDQKQWRELWVARNWITYGKPTDGPAPGVIAIYGRGTGGHVGIVTALSRRPGFVVLKSGNDGGVVRERERSIEGVIAWRMPE